MIMPRLETIGKKAHWESIKINYSKAPFFDFYKDEIEDMYLNKK